METHAFTHCPDPDGLSRDLWAARAELKSPPFAETCNVTAAEFRALARDWYELGDESRGDQMTARALAWELAGESGDLSLVRR